MESSYQCCEAALYAESDIVEKEVSVVTYTDLNAVPQNYLQAIIFNGIFWGGANIVGEILKRILMFEDKKRKNMEGSTSEKIRGHVSDNMSHVCDHKGNVNP